MMTIKKKRLIITMIATVIIVTVVTIALIILSQNKNLFKSQNTVVKEYIGQVFDRFANIINFNYEEQVYNSLDEKIYESSTEIVLNNKKKDAKLKLISDSEVDNSDDYKYNYTKFSYGEETIAEVEYLRQDEIMGIRLKDLIKQYVSVKNEKLNELVQNIQGFDKEKYTIPEKLKNIDIYNEVKLSEEEKKTLKEKYIEIIYKNINAKEITKQKDSIVTVGKQTVTANSYIIVINKKELDNIYIEILEKLKTDEVILNKISNLENIFGKYILNQEDFIKNYYINIIDKILEEIKNNQEEYEVKFTIYEVNNSVVKINVEHEFKKINLELLNANEISIIIWEIENEKQITITKKDGQLKLDVTTLVGEEETNFSIEGNITNENENIKTKISIIYNNDEEKALYVNNNIKIVDKIEEKYDVEENNIILSDLDEKNLNKIVNAVTNKIKKEIPKRLKILQKALDINIIGDMVINESGKTESEKNLFNAKFEFYAGENISKENVKKLLEVAKAHLNDIEIISENTKEEAHSDDENIKETKKEIKLRIKENTKYEESLEEVEKILEETNTYKVEIEYNNDTELIEYITITNNE